jgi:hypothetical protein
VLVYKMLGVSAAYLDSEGGALTALWKLADVLATLVKVAGAIEGARPVVSCLAEDWNIIGCAQLVLLKHALAQSGWDVTNGKVIVVLVLAVVDVFGAGRTGQGIPAWHQSVNPQQSHMAPVSQSATVTHARQGTYVHA